MANEPLPPGNRAQRRRDNKAEYAKRKLRAAELGFRSPYERSKYRAAITTHRECSRLPEYAATRRAQVLSVIAEARRSGEPVEDVAERRQIPISAVRYWGEGALYPTTGRGTRVRPADRLLRVRHVVFEGGDQFEAVAIRGSRKADLADQVFQMQWDFLHGQASTGDVAQFEGVTIGGRRVETDPDALEHMGAAGFDVELASRLVVS